METQHEIEINFVDLFYYLKKKIVIIVAAFLVFAVAGFVVSQFFISPKYTASTRMYVLNRSSEANVAYSDIQISTQLLNDYKVLIVGQNVTKEVIATLGLDMSPSALASKISVTAPDNTRVLQINVTDTDPQRAAAIANSVREVASKQIEEIMDVGAVKLVYEADVPTAPSSPDVMKNTVFASLIGLALSIVVLSVIFVLDDTIRTEEDVERYLGLSTLGVIPVLSGAGASNRQRSSK